MAWTLQWGLAEYSLSVVAVEAQELDGGQEEPARVPSVQAGFASSAHHSEIEWEK